MKGTVFDIKRFSIHDGPGIRTTVFLKGCPLSCWWCHNPEGQSPGPELVLRANRCIGCGACVEACPNGAIFSQNGLLRTDRGKCTLCGSCVEVCYTGAREIAGQVMTVEEVMAEIERDVPFYDGSGGGVTFSGGEPLLQRDFLLDLLRACRQRNVHTAVDTSGLAPPETVERVGELADLFLYDLKLMDEERHRRYTGVSNRLILENLRALAGQGRRVILRVPVVPGINDDDGNVRRIGELAAELGLDQVCLLPYHHTGADKYRRLGKDYLLPEVRPPSEERMEELAQVLRAFGLQVKVGG